VKRAAAIGLLFLAAATLAIWAATRSPQTALPAVESGGTTEPLLPSIPDSGPAPVAIVGPPPVAAAAPDAGPPSGILEVQVLHPDDTPLLNGNVFCRPPEGEDPELHRIGLQGYVELPLPRPCDLFVGYGMRTGVLVRRYVQVQEGQRLHLTVRAPDDVFVTGSVERPDGSKVFPARVKATHGAWWEASKVVDSLGAFRIATPPGPVELKVDSPAWVSQPWRGDAPASNVRLVAYPAMALTVVTLDAIAREPIPCAQLRLSTALFDILTETEKDARVTVKVPQGTTRLEAFALCGGRLLGGKGFVSEMEHRERTAWLPLLPRPGIHGHVLSPSGSPVSGARVVAAAEQSWFLSDAGLDTEMLERLTPNGPGWSPRDAFAVTDSNGTFELIPGNLSFSAEYRIRVFATGFRERPVPVLASLSTPDFDIVLEPLVNRLADGGP
jgi:hypothetical protein